MGGNEICFVDMPSRDVCKQGAVGPEVDAYAIGMGSSKEFSGRRESQSGASPFDTHGIDEVAGWKIPDTDHGIHRRGNDPAAIVRKAEVTNLADAAPEFSDEFSGFDVDDSDGEVIAAEGY